MRSLILMTLSGAALFAFSAPALAHPNDGDDQHQDQHEQLGEEHQDVHGQLIDIHNDAHDEGLSWYDHQRLHHQIDRAHVRADGSQSPEDRICPPVHRTIESCPCKLKSKSPIP